MFKLTKILNQGTDNPIINRINLQFSEMLKSGFIQVEETQKDKINSVLFECMKDLISAEESFHSYINLENSEIESISNGNYVRTSNSIQYDDPTIQLVKFFEMFVMRCVIALRRTIKIAELVLNMKFDGPKKLLSHLKNRFENDKEYLRMLDEDTEWYVELYDIRGAVEHSEININKFEVDIYDERIAIRIPELAEKRVTLREYMDVTLYNVCSYCEDFIAMIFSLVCFDLVRIIKLQDDDMKDHRNFRYIIYLKQELIDTLPDDRT